MADVEMIKFEAAVEKLCADWEVDIAKAIKHEQDLIDQRTKALTQQILALPFPNDDDPDQLGKVPGRINEILRDEGKAVWDMVTADLTAFVDKASGKLTISGHVMMGAFNNPSL